MWWIDNPRQMYLKNKNSNWISLIDICLFFMDKVYNSLIKYLLLVFSMIFNPLMIKYFKNT